MKIMVVDDNTVNLATLEQELKDKYEVIPMMTGRRAIKYLYQNRVDLILLDVQMPIMDGIETLKEIRTQDNGVVVPVIFLTAKKDAVTVLEGSKLGIMDYIIKPFDPEDLRERIERVFKRLGMLPMEPRELYNRIDEIHNDIVSDKIKTALTKTEEVLRYQLQEDIKGRVHNAKVKMETNDTEGAKAMIERVMAILGKDLEVDHRAVSMPINIGEISARLLYILDDLENFRLKEAETKFEDLQGYDVGDRVREKVDEAVEKLKDYDDVSAEAIIRELLAELKSNTRPVLGSEGAIASDKNTAGGNQGNNAGGLAGIGKGGFHTGYRGNRLK